MKDNIDDEAHQKENDIQKKMEDDNDDSLLQLALSIGPRLDDPNENALNHCSTNDLRKIDNDDQDESDNKAADLFSQRIPQNASDLTSVDSGIASQMAKLSVTDREQVYMDVHGVSGDYVNETPELIHLSLLDLQNEIEMLPDKRAYNIALRSSPEYVHNQEFLLMFLRCEKFDCEKAALRIIRHFQMKLDLFGMEKLVMDITQDDLDEDDMDVLYSCTGRFLNARDRGGRVINLIDVVMREFKTDAALRKAFYNIMVAFRDDVEVQRRGAVNVVFHVQGGVGIAGGNPDLLWKLPKLNEGSPMRITAIHWCWSHQVWKEQQALLKASFSKPLQVRLRVHHGTVQQCLEELQGHGIDPSSIPIDYTGKMTDLIEERQRLEERRLYERLNFPLRSIIHVPFSHDVLLGKGTPYQYHPGNKHLRRLVSDHIKLYDKSEKWEKKSIAMGIIEAIREKGGLFLKQDGGKWTRVTEDVARLKVTAAFRTYRQSQKL